MTEFVEGWVIAQILGEGAYGEVKLLINPVHKSAVAVKTIDLLKHPAARPSVFKEAAIHRNLSHPQIIKFYGQREDATSIYLFLEYAAGGELFDRIEPEVGMAQWEAQKFFRQLISGVEYLHSKGIAHRDLKPENVLLDLGDNLKISDFGLATVFRMNGKERPLDKKCGTLPYVAPEVLVRSYLAEPADIWSCGIILVAMLAGELPWDKPTPDCVEYLEWKDNRHMQRSPWNRLDVNCLSLIRRILAPLPSTRFSIEKIKAHRWYVKHIGSDIVDGPVRSEFNSTAKRLRSDLDTTPHRSFSEDDRACISQPEPFALRGPMGSSDMEPHLFSFSQPTHLDDLLVSSQFVSTQPSTQTHQSSVQKLVRRMTRFFVKYSAEEAVTTLCMILDKLGYSWRCYTPAIVTISTVDSRKAQLVFKASVLSLDSQTLLDFRLSKGCGIEFKRRFLAIKRALAADIINKPISWSVAIATNNV